MLIIRVFTLSGVSELQHQYSPWRQAEIVVYGEGLAGQHVTGLGVAANHFGITGHVEGIG